jgi:hypothetical protein
MFVKMGADPELAIPALQRATNSGSRLYQLEAEAALRIIREVRRNNANPDEKSF